MNRTFLALCLVISLPLRGRAADAAAPAPLAKSARDIDWHASGSLPPGTEYHLLYEDAKTHAVELLVRMPDGYALPAHSHAHDETIYVVKGRLVLGFGARTETVAAGGYAVIPAGTVFTMKVAAFGGAQLVAAFNGPFDIRLAGPDKL